MTLITYTASVFIEADRQNWSIPRPVLIRLDGGREGIKAPEPWAAITTDHVVLLIDHNNVLPSQIKAARSGREAAADENGKRAGMSQLVPFGEDSTTVEGGLSEGAAKPRCGPRQAGTPRASAPLQWECTHAWVTLWQAQWKDSQSQSADGGYSGLVTWDVEEIQRNNLSMPNTLNETRVEGGVYIHMCSQEDITTNT